MILLTFLYIWLTEPMAFQKEASARDLIGHLGERYVRPELRHFTDSASCKLLPGVSDFAGMGGFRFVAIECSFDTPCGETVMRPVWHEPLLGAYVTGDPFWETIGVACPEALTDEAHKEFEDNWQKGG